MNRDDDNEQRRHTSTRDHGFKQCDQCERAARNYKIGTDICPIIGKKKNNNVLWYPATITVNYQLN